MHVLLVLEQRAVQGRNQLLGVALAQSLWGYVLVEQELQPVEQLRGGRLLLQPGISRTAKNDRIASSTSRGLIDG